MLTRLWKESGSTLPFDVWKALVIEVDTLIYIEERRATPSSFQNGQAFDPLLDELTEEDKMREENDVVRYLEQG